jgi:hypothetical protein
MEVALRRRLAGVAQISISQSQQSAEVTFVSGTPSFSAAAFSEAVAEAEVDVLSLEVDVCGVVDDQRVLRSSTGGQQPFVRLRGSDPVGAATICVRGRLDEGHEPPELEGAKSLP